MKKNEGMCWHEYHADHLLSWCRSYTERVYEIRNYKPRLERKNRLKFFKSVEGELPQELVEAAHSLSYKGRGVAHFNKAIKKYSAEIEALHKKECPNCLWDSETIPLTIFARFIRRLKLFLKVKH